MANPTDHYLLTGLDVHSTIWKTVADDAALAALTPIAADLGKDVLKLDDSSIHKLVETGPAVWRDITAAAAAASDHGSLTGLADDDHTQYSLADGTRGGNVVGPASATNRAVALWDGATGKLLKDAGTLSYGGIQANTLALTGGTGPALAILETGTAPSNSAGYGKYWVKSDAPCTPWFTDDDASDYQLGDVVGPASSVNTAIATFNGTTGKVLQYAAAAAISATGQLSLGSTGSTLRLYQQTGAGPGGGAVTGYGYIWLDDTSPTSLIFTDDAGVPHIISPGAGAVTLGAAATTFALTHTLMTITGDGGANTLATITGAGAGQILTLLFVDALVTVTDDNTHAADSIDLSAAFTSADDTTLQLIYNGTSWYEVSRSVN